jgi:heme/copper-type cytochrome/quinol oxidase subunit 3
MNHDMSTIRYHQSCVKTIKTISNTGIYETKNNISPLFNGTVTIFIGLILFCIRDSLRESKANYVIISNMQLVLMYCFIISESVIFCILFSMSYVYLLSPICLICKVTLIYVVMNVYELSLKSTNLLTISAIILTCNSLNNNENLICYV